MTRPCKEATLTTGGREIAPQRLLATLTALATALCVAGVAILPTALVIIWFLR